MINIKSLKLIFVFVCLFCFSCHEKEKMEVKLVAMPQYEAIQLKGESLNLFDSLVDPANIYFYDSLLFLRETKKEKKMIICDPYQSSVVNELIPSRRGPGEQIGTFSFGYNSTLKKIYSFDITLGKVLTLDMDSIYIPAYKPLSSFDFFISGVWEANVFGDSTFIAIGKFNKHRAIIFNPFTNEMDSVGGSPCINQSINDIVNRAYTGIIKVVPQKEKFVIACGQADQLEIFDLEKSNKQLLVKGPENFEPSYSINQYKDYNTISPNKDSKLGYIGLCLTDNHIYALYSGKDFFVQSSSFSNIIRTFTWEGVYLWDYVLDKEVSAITFDEVNQVFYGITSEPGAEIYRFKTIP